MLGKVLMVGEPRPVVNELERALRLNGISVDSASTAEEAYRLHRLKGFDIIVSDIDVAAMGGDGLFSRLRPDTGSRRCYTMLTCSCSRLDIVRARQSGANEYISRPLNIARLINRIVQILGHGGRTGPGALVRADLEGGIGRGSFYGFANEIRAGGMDFKTYKTLARGDKISCAIYMQKTGQRLDATGCVENVRRARGKLDYVCSVRFAADMPAAPPGVRA
jgi:DNA-binding response OmpR family regulator